MSGRLMHYADGPTTLDRSRQYREVRLDKPNGLWVSVEGDDDWASWCRDEDFHVDRLDHPYEVTLHADAKILTLTTAEQVTALSTRYPKALRFPRQEGHVDWALIAEQYQGIVIAPYQWSCRLSVRWYYGWDVALGCIWDLDAIASFELVETSVAA